MARTGSVSAEVESGVWKRLLVFDDGWVEDSGSDRVVARGRRIDQSRRVTFVGLVVGAVVLWALGGVVRAPEWFTTTVTVIVVSAMVALIIRFRWHDFGASWRQLSPPPASRQQARSAVEQARLLTGDVHVPASRIRLVRSEKDGLLNRVSVEFVDESVRAYASPDGALVELLMAFDRSGN